ncbi:uncharacterized protein SOCE26_052700 [Sorangium cellulosum]|uniref:Uncharacterized protein n=1 Tax=Sorangium cellulosum TaxID=56 RepID=A0A2L0EX23_SORCE|nr:hypothetical protein [Sorangium cellulosum]AUX43815.1 uncharacterized protein SOCE26_052700 [Sorangium cellulosum]
MASTALGFPNPTNLTKLDLAEELIESKDREALHVAIEVPVAAAASFAVSAGDAARGGGDAVKIGGAIAAAGVSLLAEQAGYTGAAKVAKAALTGAVCAEAATMGHEAGLAYRAKIEARRAKERDVEQAAPPTAGKKAVT